MKVSEAADTVPSPKDNNAGNSEVADQSQSSRDEHGGNNKRDAQVKKYSFHILTGIVETEWLTFCHKRSFFFNVSSTRHISRLFREVRGVSSLSGPGVIFTFLPHSSPWKFSSSQRQTPAALGISCHLRHSRWFFPSCFGKTNYSWKVSSARTEIIMWGSTCHGTEVDRCRNWVETIICSWKLANLVYPPWETLKLTGDSGQQLRSLSNKLLIN